MSVRPPTPRILENLTPRKAPLKKVESSRDSVAEKHPEESSARLFPIILIPGVCGSKIDAINRQTNEVERAWITRKLLPIPRLGEMAVKFLWGAPDSKGVFTSYLDQYARTVVVPGIDGCDRLIENWWVDAIEKASRTLKFGHYFYTIVYRLVKYYGYLPGKNLFGFSYDWRQILNSSLILDPLEKLIEHAMSLNDNKKVIVICHSMGGLVMKTYMQHKPRWPGQIRRFLAIAVPFDGSTAQSYQGFINGHNLDIIAVSQCAARGLQAKSTSTLYIGSKPHCAANTYGYFTSCVYVKRYNSTTASAPSSGKRYKRHSLSLKRRSSKNDNPPAKATLVSTKSMPPLNAQATEMRHSVVYSPAEGSMHVVPLQRSKSGSHIGMKHRRPPKPHKHLSFIKRKLPAADAQRLDVRLDFSVYKTAFPDIAAVLMEKFLRDPSIIRDEYKYVTYNKLLKSIRRPVIKAVHGLQRPSALTYPRSLDKVLSPKYTKKNYLTPIETLENTDNAWHWEAFSSWPETGRANNNCVLKHPWFQKGDNGVVLLKANAPHRDIIIAGTFGNITRWTDCRDIQLLGSAIAIYTSLKNVIEPLPKLLLSKSGTHKIKSSHVEFSLERHLAEKMRALYSGAAIASGHNGHSADTRTGNTCGMGRKRLIQYTAAPWSDILHYSEQSIFSVIAQINPKGSIYDFLFSIDPFFMEEYKRSINRDVIGLSGLISHHKRLASDMRGKVLDPEIQHPRIEDASTPMPTTKICFSQTEVVMDFSDDDETQKSPREARTSSLDRPETKEKDLSEHSTISIGHIRMQSNQMHEAQSVDSCLQILERVPSRPGEPLSRIDSEASFTMSHACGSVYDPLGVCPLDSHITVIVDKQVSAGGLEKVTESHIDEQHGIHGQMDEAIYRGLSRRAGRTLKHATQHREKVVTVVKNVTNMIPKYKDTDINTTEFRFCSIVGSGISTPLHLCYSRPVHDYIELCSQLPTYINGDGDGSVGVFSSLNDGFPDELVIDRVVLPGLKHFALMHDDCAWKQVKAILGFVRVPRGVSSSVKVPDILETGKVEERQFLESI